MSAPELDCILAAATDAAHAAARGLRQAWRAQDFGVMQRDRNDVKLSADVESERTIAEVLRRRRPQDGILAEEGGARDALRDGVWIVDPLDGTINFAHAHPHFSVSIAWLWKRETHVGIVYDVLRDELYAAVKGCGATCNGKPIRAAQSNDVGRSLVAMGFGKSMTDPRALENIRVLTSRVQRMRISGSAALDLAFVACGRLDAYTEASIFVWDLAAGALLVEEAGGTCLMWPRGQRHQRACLAATRALAPQLLSLFGLDEKSCARTCLDDIAG